MSWRVVELQLRAHARADPQFTYYEILSKLAEDIEVGEMDSETLEEVSQRLIDLDDDIKFRQAFIDVVQLIKDCGGSDIKAEEDEEEVGALLLAEGQPPQLDYHTSWTKSLTSAYLSATLEARYNIVCSILFLLMVLAYSDMDRLQALPPAILDELFAIHRSISMLRHVASQVTRGSSGTLVSSHRREGTTDLISEKLRIMGVQQNGTTSTALESTNSLLQLFIPSLLLPFALPYASDYFLRENGILRSDSALIAGDSEVRMLEQLRQLGFLEVVLQVSEWLPKMSAVCYVVARTRLELGEPDEACDLFERVARNFGFLAASNPTDVIALRSILPSELTSLESLAKYYRHVAELFETAGHFVFMIPFCKYAIEQQDPGQSSEDLWFKVFRAQLGLGYYEEAYMTLVATPYISLRKECVTHLVQVMCEEDQVELLMRFNFVGFFTEVEQALAFKARNADPLSRPLYSQVLYGWYIQRGDYRNAALTMYHRARKLSEIGPPDPSTFEQLLTFQIDALTVSMAALSLLDPRNAWVSVPMSLGEGAFNRTWKHGGAIPPEKFAMGCEEVEIVELEDIQREFSLCTARQELARRTISSDYRMSALEALQRYLNLGMFEEALFLANAFREDMTSIFGSLANQCVRLSRSEDIPTEQESGWLRAEHVAQWEGSYAEKAWRLLQQSLDRYDNVKDGFRYRKASVERIMDSDRALVPSWLTRFFEINEPEWLIRMYWRYELITPALDCIMAMISKSNDVLKPSIMPTNQTRLPYTLIDTVIDSASTPEDKKKAALIKAAVTERVGKLKKLK